MEDDRDGWLPLPGTRKDDRFAHSLSVFPFFFLGDSIILSLLFAILLYIPIRLILEFALWGTRRHTPEINFTTRQIGCGRKTVSFADFDRATIASVQPLEIVIEASSVFKFIVPLRGGDTLLIPEDTQQRLIEMLPMTTIAMPESFYDPKATFAKYNFPAHLTLLETIALIRNPPTPGEKLPIPN